MAQRLHQLRHVLLDGLILLAAWYAAFAFRFDRDRDSLWRLHGTLRDGAAIRVVGIQLVVFLLVGLYGRWWRYTSLRDLTTLARAVVIAKVVALLALYLFPLHFGVSTLRVPRGVIAFDSAFTLLGLIAVRAVARWYFERPRHGSLSRGRQVLVVGAGDAGRRLAQEMQAGRTWPVREPIGFLDDAKGIDGVKIHGIRVLGGVGDIRRVLGEHKPAEVVIAMPSATGAVRQQVVAACRAAGVPVTTLPSLTEILADAPLLRSLREVKVEDLLGRPPVRIDLAAAGAYVHDRCVLVTGAGGSIGSELCRQLARLGPSRLVLVDHSEGNLFEIDRELQGRGLDLHPITLDVKEVERMRRLLDTHRPAVVFHAAAYKHVPMMEANPVEAIRNNSLATRALARLAREAGVERFVLISTDKAVDPDNAMGASKTLCEWALEGLAREGNGTRFVTVRFGNVLNSSGSVIPIFRRQIEAGGPVTVTDPRMTRYFMTIPEAVQLVIEAGGVGESGDVFVLDMGDPIRISEVAERMIELSGRVPGRDIEIKVIGMRPGEKLEERLFAHDEQVELTSHEKLQRARRAPLDAVWLRDEFDELEALIEDGRDADALAHVRQMIRAPVRASDSVVSAD